MKSESNDARGKKVQPLPGRQAAAVCLDNYSKLWQFKKLLDKLQSPEGLSVIECEDLSAEGYRRCSALLTYCGWAQEGLHAGGCTVNEPIEQDVMELAKAELEKIRLAGEILYNMCRQKASEVTSGPNETAVNG